MPPETVDHRHDMAAASAAMTWRVIARGDGWSVNEYFCGAGPGDPPAEERHENVTIAAVVGGSFQYRGDSGEALLYPGSLLLGNAGTCYECGHDHGAGDHCVGFHFAPDYFEEIAASAAGSYRFRFPAPVLAASRELTSSAVDAETMARGGDPIAMEELSARLVEVVLATVSGTGRSTAAPSARDQRRIAACCVISRRIPTSRSSLPTSPPSP